MGYFKWADKQLQDLIAQNPTYQRSAYPGKQLGLANSLIGSRVPGAGQFQNNIFTSQGNQMANIGRNATDSSQALLFGAGAQGQADQSLGDLQLQEADWTKYGLQNLNQAYGANQQEDQYANQMEQQKYQNLVSLKGAQAANKMAKRKALWNTVGDIANLGVSAFTGGIFGKGGGAGKGAGGSLGSSVSYPGHTI